MKLFKRIYFPVMAILLVLATVFGFIGVYSGGTAGDATMSQTAYNNATNFGVSSRPSNSAGVQNIHSGFITALEKAGFVAAETETETELDDDGEEITITHVNYPDGEKVAAYYRMSEALTADTIAAINAAQNADDLLIEANKRINNLIVVIPGTSEDAVLFSAHLDTLPNSAGASDVAWATSLIEAACKAKSGTHANTLVFLFTDAAYDGGYGAFAFLNQFDGFDGVASHVKAAVNFDSMGNGDTVAIEQATATGGDLIKKFSKAYGAALSSSAFDSVFAEMPSDFAAYANIPALNIVSYGGDKAGTIDDNAANLTEKTVAKMVGAVSAAVESIGGAQIVEAENPVHFSVMGLFNVSYSKIVSYILSAIVLVLALLGVILNVKTKAFGMGDFFKGIAAVLLSLVATTAAMFVLYFIVALILAATGVITMQMMLNFVFTNVGVIIAFMAVAAALAAIFFALLKNTFKIRATDLVRGTAVLWSVASAIIGFVMPAAAYAFVIPAVIVSIIFFITTLAKNSFRAKKGLDIERLMLYFIPVVIALPLYLPLVAVINATYSMMFMTLTMIPFMLLCGLFMPYTVLLKPGFDKVLAKLPEHKARVERTYAEPVKVTTAKGTVYTNKVVTTEKVKWQYSHNIAMTVVAVIASVLIICFSAFGTGFGKAVTADSFAADSYSSAQNIYEDSVVISSDSTANSGKENVSFVIKDQMVYRELAGALNGYEWDDEVKGYVKKASYSDTLMPQIVREGDATLKFTPADFTVGSGKIYITLYNTADVITVTVTDEEGEVTVIDNTGKSTITVCLSAENEHFEIELEYAEGRLQNTIKMDYEQYATGGRAENAFDHVEASEWANIYENFEDSEFFGSLRRGVAVKRTGFIV